MSSETTPKEAMGSKDEATDTDSNVTYPSTINTGIGDGNAEQQFHVSGP